jgi:hypothetical protein
MKKFLFFALLAIDCYGQSVLEDAQGKSGMYSLKGGGNVKLNFSDAAATLAYARPFANSDSGFRFGYSVTGKSNGGVASLVSKGEFVPTVSASMVVGYRNWLFEPLRSTDTADKGEDGVFLEIAPSYSQFKTIDTSLAYDKQLKKDNFWGGMVALSYAARYHNVLASGRVQAERKSNFDDLKSVQVADERIVYSSTTQKRSLVTTNPYRLGALTDFVTYSARLDMVAIPDFFHNRIGLDFNLKMPALETDFTVVPGMGILLTENGAPSKVVGGLSVAFPDDKISLGLIAGYNF